MHLLEKSISIIKFVIYHTQECFTGLMLHVKKHNIQHQKQYFVTFFYVLKHNFWVKICQYAFLRNEFVGNTDNI